MNKLPYYISLGRPLYVVPAAVSALAGFISAGGGGHELGNVILVFSSFFLIYFSSWVTNEVADMSSDSLGARKVIFGMYVSGGTGLLLGGEVRRDYALVLAAGSAIVGLIMAAFIGIYFTLCGIVFLIITSAYSVRPVRLKGRGLWGVVSIALSVGCVAFQAGWIASGYPPSILGLVFSLIAVIFIMGIESIPHIIDRVDDRVVGDETIAVTAGVRGTLLLVGACGLVSFAALCVMYESLNYKFFLITLGAYISSCIFLKVCAISQGSLCALRLLSVPVVCSFLFCIS